MTTEAVALREADALPVWNPRQVVAQVKLIQDVMRDVMHKDEHYGTIPGTQKPTLLKPGAEKLCLTFRLSPTYEITEKDLGGGHREYRITCRLTSIQTGAVIGDGVGVCSTMESKYRYRHAEPEDTGVQVPGAYWDAKKKNEMVKMQEALGGKGMAAKKNKAGQWTIHKMAEGKVENPDIADTYNTVLKMAKKRAMVDAAITATGASDIFTQDVEDTLPEPLQTPQSPAVSQPAAHDERSIMAAGANRVEPPSTAGDASLMPPTTDSELPPSVDDWKEAYAAAGTQEEFDKLEAQLKRQWAKYEGEEKTALKFMRDRRRVELQQTSGKLA